MNRRMRGEKKWDADRYAFALRQICVVCLAIPFLFGKFAKSNLETARQLNASREDWIVSLFVTIKRDAPLQMVSILAKVQTNLPVPCHKFEVILEGDVPVFCVSKSKDGQELIINVRLEDSNVPTKTCSGSISFDFGSEGILSVPVIFLTL
jgi:hypothetical protein